MAADNIQVESGVSARTGKGFVTITFGSEAGQLDAEEAKRFGLSVIEAACASEADASVYAWASKSGLDGPEIAVLLSELRAARGQNADQSGRVVMHLPDGQHRENAL